MTSVEAETWHTIRAPFLGMQGWQRNVSDGHLTVLLSVEDGAVHMSISHRTNDTLQPGRYPTWDEIVEARYRFCPANVHMVMVLPPREEYVNIHATTFHLWQSREDWS